MEHLNNIKSTKISPLVFIMAGGIGKRMNSTIPKVLHCIKGKPMLVYIVENSWNLNPSKIVIIVGKYNYLIKKTLKEYLSKTIFECIEFAFQPVAQGTADAIKCGINSLSNCYSSHTPVLILNGDTPLVTTNTMKIVIENMKKCRIVTTKMIDPTGYGRIIIENNKFKKIVEDKDCTREELSIDIVNTGIYAIYLHLLKRYIPKIKNNNYQQEYYLTDLFGLLVSEQIEIQIYEMPIEYQMELIGINTKEQLERLNQLLDCYV